MMAMGHSDAIPADCIQDQSRQGQLVAATSNEMLQQLVILMRTWIWHGVLLLGSVCSLFGDLPRCEVTILVLDDEGRERQYRIDSVRAMKGAADSDERGLGTSGMTIKGMQCGGRYQARLVPLSKEKHRHGCADEARTVRELSSWGLSDRAYVVSAARDCYVGDGTSRQHYTFRIAPVPPWRAFCQIHPTSQTGYGVPASFLTVPVEPGGVCRTSILSAGLYLVSAFNTQGDLFAVARVRVPGWMDYEPQKGIAVQLTPLKK